MIKRYSSKVSSKLNSDKSALICRLLNNNRLIQFVMYKYDNDVHMDVVRKISTSNMKMKMKFSEWINYS